MKNAMKKNLFKLLGLILTVSMVGSFAACGKDGGGDPAEAQRQEEAAPGTELEDGKNDTQDGNDGAANEGESAGTQDSNAGAGEGTADSNVVGQGATIFTFQVVDGEGQETVFEVHTDAQTVGEALQACDLIQGEESEYGLYVKTVNGITADYDVDQTYWAFYINGEYAMTGVDKTEVVDGDTYTFKVEK